MGAKARKRREAKTRPKIVVDEMIYYADELARIHSLILHNANERCQKLAHDLIRKAARDQVKRRAP